MFEEVNTGIKTTPSGMAFTDNPIILSNNFEDDAPAVTGYPFTITMGGTAIYNGRFSYPFSINIAEIIKANVKYFDEPGKIDQKKYGPITVIEDDIKHRIVYTIFDGATDGPELMFIAIPGGVSKQNYRRLKQLNASSDIFVERFFALNANFFMTTRTADWRLVMKETELYPLYFINDCEDGILEIKERTTGKSFDSEMLPPGVFALDINALRKFFFTEFGVLTNSFDIYRQGNYSCRIVIEQSELKDNGYRLKFRNSLGVFEIIELVGKMTINPQWEGADDKIYHKYDDTVDDFYSQRDRLERQVQISVETGVKCKEELRFLMDMLASDEVYLLDLTEIQHKVIPSIEEFSYSNKQQVPEKFTLSLKLAETEINILQEIINGNEYRKPRIFSNQFNDKFN